MINLRTLLIFSVLAWCCGAFAQGEKNSPSSLEKIAVEFERDNGAATLSFSLSSDATYSLYTLDSPARVVIDFQNTRWNSSTKTLRLPVWLTKIRHATKEDGTLRVVLDCKEAVSVPAELARKNSASSVTISLLPRSAVGALVKNFSAEAAASNSASVQKEKSTKDVSKKETISKHDNPFIEQTPAPASEESLAIDPSIPIPHARPSLEKKSEMSEAPSPSVEKNSDKNEDEKKEIALSAEKKSSATTTLLPSASENVLLYIPTWRNGVPLPILRPSVKLPLIVIDAGHGGHDPGTRGAKGTFEKYLTLQYALALKLALLETNRYRVVLTREDDRYITLRERVLTAQRLHGDFFISLHADSHPDNRTQGLSVYTLSERASDKEAEALAQKENLSDIVPSIATLSTEEDVNHALVELAQRHTKNTSARFAETLVGTLTHSVRLLPKPHRFAGFKVLTAPDVPSALVELGYLSNPREEFLLLSSEYKKRLVNAMVMAIDTHFSTTPPGEN